MNKKIIISLAVIGAVAAIAISGTIAYFSDTETSTGNTFTAGAIDLTIDNESYVTNNEGVLVASPKTSWEPGDLSVLGTRGGTDLAKLFFNFTDLKPGDIGEDTISIHVNNNDAWACLAIQITEDSDNTCTEPEKEDDSDCAEYATVGDGTYFNGELADELQFAVWADDGDNVFEVGERLLQLGGAGDPIVTLQELAGLYETGGPAGVLTLADSDYSVFTADPNPGEALVGGQTYHLAKAWCFGTLTENPRTEGGDLDPLDGTGFNCDGGSVNNAAQTDRVKGNITFYAEQARNNPDFTCVQPERFTSSVLSYSSTGWAGWSCPMDMYAVGGGVIENDYSMGAEGIAKSGATIGGSTYPTFPHYTFDDGETGYVAQNGGTPQTAKIFVDCLPK